MIAVLKLVLSSKIFDIKWSAMFQRGLLLDRNRLYVIIKFQALAFLEELLFTKWDCFWKRVTFKQGLCSGFGIVDMNCFMKTSDFKQELFLTYYIHIHIYIYIYIYIYILQNEWENKLVGRWLTLICQCLQYSCCYSITSCQKD